MTSLSGGYVSRSTPQRSRATAREIVACAHLCDKRLPGTFFWAPATTDFYLAIDSKRITGVAHLVLETCAPLGVPVPNLADSRDGAARRAR